MPYSAPSTPSATDFPATSGVSLAARTTAPEHVSASAGTQESKPAQTAQLVREIRDIGEHISAIERNSVEVRFDFDRQDRLSVRIEYRDGTVHTTFRTDSPGLRAAISQEWQSQSVVSEQRSYRVADPVFSPESSARQDFSAAGDGSGRRHAADQQQSPSSSPSAGFSRNASTTTAHVPARAAARRPETSLHLHALA